MSCDSDRAQYTRAQIRRNSDILKKLRENSDKGTTPTRSNTAPQKICKEGSDTGIKNKRTSPARRSQAGSSFDGAESKESVIRSRLSTRSISKLLLSGVLDGTSFRSSQSVPRGRVYSRESSRETPAIRSSYTTSLAGDADLQDGYDPPRPPRPGMEWVWFPEGYWAERELPPSSNYASASLLKWTRRNNNQSSSSHASVYSNTSEAADGRWRTRSSPTGPTGPLDRLAAPTGKSRRSPKNRDGRSSASPNSKSILGKLQYMSPTYPHFKSPDGSPEGLYCKTKRVLGSDSRRRAMVGSSSFKPIHVTDRAQPVF